MTQQNNHRGRIIKTIEGGLPFFREYEVDFSCAKRQESVLRRVVAQEI